MITCTVLLAPDPAAGGYTVTAPALPGCTSRGKTVEECLHNAEEAIRRHLDGLSASGEPVRDPVTLRVLALATRDEAPQLCRPPFTRVFGARSAAGADDVG